MYNTLQSNTNRTYPILTICSYVSQCLILHPWYSAWHVDDVRKIDIE